MVDVSSLFLFNEILSDTNIPRPSYSEVAIGNDQSFSYCEHSIVTSNAETKLTHCL